jgi:hypothetical protein
MIPRTTTKEPVRVRRSGTSVRASIRPAVQLSRLRWLLMVPFPPGCSTKGAIHRCAKPDSRWSPPLIGMTTGSSRTPSRSCQNRRR